MQGDPRSKTRPEQPGDEATPSARSPNTGAGEQFAPERKPVSDRGASSPDGVPNPENRQERAKLVHRLEELAKQPQRAQDARKQAEQIRKQAQEIMKNASPEQIEQAKRWAQDLARNSPPPSSDGSSGDPRPSDASSGDSSNPLARLGGNGGGSLEGRGGPTNRPQDAAFPTRTETVDARPRSSNGTRDGNRERVIAEWYADSKPDRSGREGTPLTPEAESTLREAVREGEHAVDTEAVPTRYDKLIRKYFQRLGDRAKAPAVAAPASANTPPAPAETAQDAPLRPAAPASKP